MIEILPESNSNFLAVSAKEKLTVDDYEKVFIPKLEELIRNYETVRVLIFFHDNFTGWDKLNPIPVSTLMRRSTGRMNK